MCDPAGQLWFHGRISRDQSEKLLRKTDLRDGTYLLRESTSTAGSYVLSVCYNRKIVHYQIQKKRDGTVGIEDGPRFVGPVELVQHHEVNLDGLLTRLCNPCHRARGVKAKAYQNVSHDDLEEATRQVLLSEGIESEDAVVRFKVEFEDILGNILHKKQPWFHGIIPREEADHRLEKTGCKDGVYLFRERGSPRGSYVLGLCANLKVYHYLFDPNPKGQLSIKSGRLFDNLMQVVEYYSHKSDGLLLKLDKPCDKEQFQFNPQHPTTRRNFLLDQDIQAELRKKLSQYENELSVYRRTTASTLGSTRPPLPSPRRPPSLQLGSAVLGTSPGRACVTMQRSPHSPRRPPAPLPSVNASDAQAWKYEKIYDTSHVRTMEGFSNPFNDIAEPRNLVLDTKRLKLEEELGHGNFGSVVKGVYTLQNFKKIAVAVKTLKEEDIPNQKPEIVHEAEIMAKLDHPNIVRMIGITQGSPMMLLMELAPQGPLNKYLKKHRDMVVLNVLILMLQVNEGMQYLESQHFVHRDLAARNVLVVSENFVKISDFGMSRAMGMENQYYRAERAGKWPLKWYAPECVYFYKFTSKSDVWSYGITLWEALSYGAKPYSGMKGQELVERLEKNFRLERPEKCPQEIYTVMRKCWEYSPENRPCFLDIGHQLFEYIDRHHKRKK